MWKEETLISVNVSACMRVCDATMERRGLSVGICCSPCVGLGVNKMSACAGMRA